MAITKNTGKRRKAVARGAAVIISALVGLGLWAAIAGVQQPQTTSTPNNAIVSPAPATNPNFSTSDGFLTQSSAPNVQTGGQQPSASAQTTTRPRLRTRAS